MGEAIKRWTFTYPNNAKAQLDYILINKMWRNSMEHTPHLKEYLLYHRIVTAKTHLSLRRNKLQTVEITHYDWFSFTNKYEVHTISFQTFFVWAF